MNDFGIKLIKCSFQLKISDKPNFKEKNCQPYQGLNEALHFLHLSMLHGWTAYEYKWYPMGISIKERLALVETRWSYFLGFGFPLAMTAIVRHGL